METCRSEELRGDRDRLDLTEHLLDGRVLQDDQRGQAQQHVHVESARQGRAAAPQSHRGGPQEDQGRVSRGIHTPERGIPNTQGRPRAIVVDPRKTRGG